MRLSIITINYNNAEGLRQTLASVAAQTCHDIEHIIIDGGSTDRSVDIIRDYESSNSLNSNSNSLTLSWVSEKDNGIYDAMNKGIKKATGDYLYFLNSGDVMADENVIKKAMAQLGDADIVVGRVNKVAQGRILGKTDLLSESDMSMYQMYLHGINHQSAIIRRSIQLEHLYDASLKIGADWKFFVETIVLGGANVKFVDSVFANYDVAGVSSNTVQLRQEREMILADILPERIARDYIAIAPHYFEVIRVEWLLHHPFWYKLYRGLTTSARKIYRR